jgi:hypothetical protein
MKEKAGIGPEVEKSLRALLRRCYGVGMRMTLELGDGLSTR